MAKRSAGVKAGQTDGAPRAYKGRSARTVAQYDAYLAILHAAETLQRQLTELLRESDLSLAQYNVLRILRGAGSTGLACGEVAGRMIRHDPDMTRLLDRLEKRHLTERTREPKDRRVVRTRITQAGLTLLADLDEPIDALHERQLGHLSPDRLADLTAVLHDTRERLA
jgi:DNA-binding MarR family transcriptional regulator